MEMMGWGIEGEREGEREREGRGEGMGLEDVGWVGGLEFSQGDRT